MESEVEEFYRLSDWRARASAIGFGTYTEQDSDIDLPIVFDLELYQWSISLPANG